MKDGDIPGVQLRRSVIFDLDGTLADTGGDLLAAANACFRGMGHGDVLDLERDRGVSIRGGRALLLHGLAQLGAPGDHGAIAQAQYPRLLEAYAQALHVHSTFYPGALEAVAELSARGYAVGICTNKPEALADRLLTSMGARAAFASLIGADTLATRKPDAGPLIEAVRRAGGAPDRAVLVGDTDIDRDTARAAGMPSILVDFGPNGHEMAALEPEALLHDFADLPDMVRDLIG